MGIRKLFLAYAFAYSELMSRLGGRARLDLSPGGVARRCEEAGDGLRSGRIAGEVLGWVAMFGIN
jgi:hypothetical protein